MPARPRLAERRALIPSDPPAVICGMHRTEVVFSASGLFDHHARFYNVPVDRCARRGSQQWKPRGHRRRKMRRTRAKMNQCLPCFIVTAVIMGFFCQGVDSASGEFARKLLSDLFQNYTSSIRPVRNTSRPITVTFGVALAQIIDMQEGFRLRLRTAHDKCDHAVTLALKAFSTKDRSDVKPLVVIAFSTKDRAGVKPQLWRGHIRP
ncbi:acetylcholine-gated cation-selective channel [Branchiostoma belcheri]|nr:acetylcholine-gated cation-selective channel [Branchiostoma belcheri]